MTDKILIVDDETIFLETFSEVLREEGYSVTVSDNGTRALRLLENKSFDLAILDINMPGLDGIKILSIIKEKYPDIRVIMITAYGTVEMAVEAINRGACDYVMKPVVFEDILVKIRHQMQLKHIEHQNIWMKEQPAEEYGIKNIISQSDVMQPVFETIRKVSQTHSNVLIVGESGTGKELVARAIHSSGKLKNHPFVGINCSAIPEGLLESELFGHKKGSFTSADKDKKGLFEVANGGTIFLDEIGHMALGCQVKLLRAIEERHIMPVGGSELIPFTSRVIAATNQAPLDQIRRNELREDLYYRLNVVGIYLPPLRERKSDIPLLAEHFRRKFNAEIGKNITGISPDAMEILMNHEWRGNIRELQNIIERATIFAEGNLITPNDLGILPATHNPPYNEPENLQTVLKQFEREHVLRVLNKYNHNKYDAARALGVGLSSLYRKINELNISIEEYKRKRHLPRKNRVS